MLKRVLKPGDTHLMSANEEYCRIIYERQWNAPNVFNLNVELYDKGGVRIRRSFKKITVNDEETLLQETIGDGWETIFRQDYNDWLILCQKRPRTVSNHVRYISAPTSTDTSGVWRNVLVGSVGVGIAALLVGWFIGQQPGLLTADGAFSANESSESNADDGAPGATDESPNDASVSTESSAQEDRLSDGDNGTTIPSGEFSPDLRSEGPDDAQTIGDVLFDNDLFDDSDNEVDAVDNSNDSDPANPLTEKTDENTTTADNDDDTIGLAIADDTNRNGANYDPFVSAVRLAQAAVIEGRVADTRREWLNLADQWQNAADLMAEVSRDDDRYDVAQSRVDLYETNRDVARSEAEKARSN